MNIKYFDAHAHIQFPEYDEDRAEVIARMKDAGVAAVVVGTDYRTSVAAVSLARATTICRRVSDYTQPM